MSQAWFTTHSSLVTAALVVLLLGPLIAHGHSGHMGKETSHDIDTALWLHVVFMGLAYGVIFPVGTVLGLVKHRLHVPLQAVGVCLVVVGYFLGHFHQGRHFGESAHVSFSRFVLLALGLQAGCGIYLKLHLERRFKCDPLRPFLKPIHRYLGLLTTLVAWVQVLLGFIALSGFCYADHFGQCLAHFIMGSSFVWYGVWLLLSLTLAGSWLRSKGRSPEFYDSVAILAWGIFNTFTEHRWNEPWTHKDLQHTAMGILWWAGGLVGVAMTWRTSPDSRSMIPSLIILFTGLAMGAHHQHTEFSTKIHAFFGGSLTIAAVTRIIELILLTQQRAHLTTALGASQDPPIQPFQYIPVFFLMLSGTMFMSANEESLHTLMDWGADPASYALLIVSVAFMLFFVALSLINLYKRLREPQLSLGQYQVVGVNDLVPPYGPTDHVRDDTHFPYDPRHSRSIYSPAAAEAHTQTIFDVASRSSLEEDDDPRSAVTLREELEMRSVGGAPPQPRLPEAEK
ncbi:hypothetical protein H4R35_005057 [Dimargaris xerosporica]|nr:hypothetical protein H4R35_005057 [Dimargaris xerosporica]